MELQFQTAGIPCLYTVKREVQTQEQTQEVKLSDGMPDIGSVLGAWGQVILRSKEWQSDGMSVSGGTMVWVQYLPEGGGEVQCVECWIPFQMRWPFSSVQHDGRILAQCLLKSVDARTTSARKMMLRSNIAVLAHGLETRQAQWYQPENVPEDVQLCRKRYPVLLPKEAGEKAFALEETLTLPHSVPKLERMICYHLQPEITEEKLMGDKLIFRGIGHVHLLYLADDGGQYSWDFELPFSQYSELEQMYEDDGQIMIWPCVTALEAEMEEGQIHLKAGLVCQYRISDRPVIEVVTDAYSPNRTVQLHFQDLELPGILESKEQTLQVQSTSAVEGLRVADVRFMPQPVQVHAQAENVQLEIPGEFRVLYYDMEGNLREEAMKADQTVTIPADSGVKVEASAWPGGKALGNLLSGNLQMQAELSVQTDTLMQSGIPMVDALELGELQEPDPNRPSLILCRAGERSLWEVAKDSGSTVEAIRQANQLQDEPEAQRMLLIPVK